MLGSIAAAPFAGLIALGVVAAIVVVLIVVARMRQSHMLGYGLVRTDVGGCNQPPLTGRELICGVTDTGMSYNECMRRTAPRPPPSHSQVIAEARDEEARAAHLIAAANADARAHAAARAAGFPRQTA